MSKNMIISLAVAIVDTQSKEIAQMQQWEQMWGYGS